jgi:hypothetical protein
MKTGVLCGGAFHPMSNISLNLDDQMDIDLDWKSSTEDLVHSLPSSLRQSIHLTLFSVESTVNRDLMRAVGSTE